MDLNLRLTLREQMVHIDIRVRNRFYPKFKDSYSYSLVIGGRSFSFASPSNDFMSSYNYRAINSSMESKDQIPIKCTPPAPNPPTSPKLQHPPKLSYSNFSAKYHFPQKFTFPNDCFPSSSLTHMISKLPELANLFDPVSKVLNT